MKYIQPIIILALLILLVSGWLHYSNKTGKADLNNIKEKYDSAIKPHELAIIQIERKRKLAVLKLRIDSAKHVKETQSFRKEISILRKQLKDVKYTGNPATVPDDSVKIAMQALLEAPVKDSIIHKQEYEIIRLNTKIEELHNDYAGLLDGYQEQLNNVNDIAELRKKQVEELEQKNKKLRHKGIWNGVKIGVVALGVGFVIGLSR